MATYMCDGTDCGFESDSEEEVARHVMAAECVDAWGVLEVGGPAHVAFLKGVHPMVQVTDLVADLYTASTLEQNGIET
jgi:hypothetical protein